MASSVSSSSQLLLFTLLLFLTFSHNLLVSSVHQPDPESEPEPEPEKVKINLYYETLCPYCQSFIVNDLVKVFDTDLYTISDLRLVPFGNGEIHGSSSISCQHGEEECYLNAIEACAIYSWPDPKKHFSFIRCVESSVALDDEPHAAWRRCAKNFAGQKLIEDCYNGGLSTQLILGYANETNRLQPPHTFVPWVTVDGAPLYDNVGNFVSEVCKAYKGKEIPLPKICSSSAAAFAHHHMLSSLQACYP